MVLLEFIELGRNIDPMQLSVIIPVYNASDYINDSVDQILEYLENLNLEYELILVNDGSTDDTLNVLNNLSGNKVKICSLSVNQGKYAAISKGMSEATGDCCLFTDADLPFDLSAIQYAYTLISSNVIHLVVGDRMLKASQSQVSTSLIRQFYSLALSVIIRLLMTGGLYDSQCGFKAFRKDVAKQIFSMLRFKRFSGDIEVLYIALKYNLTIKRIPVKLINSKPTTVNPFADSFGFLRCIFSMRINWDRGFYVSKDLYEMGSETYWSK